MSSGSQVIGLPEFGGTLGESRVFWKSQTYRVNALCSWKSTVTIKCHDQILSFLETVTYNYAQIGKDVASLSELETRSRAVPAARCFLEPALIGQLSPGFKNFLPGRADQNPLWTGVANRFYNTTEKPLNL
jgi:hypothetical protein